MGILSGIASIGGDFISKAVDYDVARRLQHDSQDFTYKMFANRHQMEVQDLIKAGLNPILSANSGGGSPGSGIASTGAMDNPAITSATMAKIQADTEQSKTASDVNVASAGKLKADEELAKQESNESRARQLLTNAQTTAKGIENASNQIDVVRKQAEQKSNEPERYKGAILDTINMLPMSMRPILKRGYVSARTGMDSMENVVTKLGMIAKQKYDNFVNMVKQNKKYGGWKADEDVQKAKMKMQNKKFVPYIDENGGVQFKER